MWRVWRTPICWVPLILLVVVRPSPSKAQDSGVTGWISIRLEQKRGDEVRVVPQNTVFHNGDIVRFRITSKTAGYLYVIDVGTSGDTSTLFPGKEETQTDNRIKPGMVSSVPVEGDGWFEVTGPPGFDILYFLVSGTPLTMAPTNPPDDRHPESSPKPGPKGNAPPKMLLPRCDDEIFKARGDCIDKSAGLAPLAENAPIPRQLAPYSQMASRDIIVSEDEDGAEVKPPASAKLPLIYSFRLAHTK